MLRKLMRLETRPGILYVHYWAGKLLQHDFANTVEDTYNELLKVCSTLMSINMGVVDSQPDMKTGMYYAITAAVSGETEGRGCCAVLWADGNLDEGCFPPAVLEGRASNRRDVQTGVGP